MVIYVGNLSSEITETELLLAFKTFGFVKSVEIKIDTKGRSKGYGFIRMPIEQEALNAINGLNGKEFIDGIITVRDAGPKSKTPNNKKRAPRKK